MLGSVLLWKLKSISWKGDFVKNWLDILAGSHGTRPWCERPPFDGRQTGPDQHIEASSNAFILSYKTSKAHQSVIHSTLNKNIGFLLLYLPNCSRDGPITIPGISVKRPHDVLTW